MAGSGPGLAADQDVPVQADHNHKCSGSDQPVDGGRGYRWLDETITWAIAAAMGQLPARQGLHLKPTKITFNFFIIQLGWLDQNH